MYWWNREKLPPTCCLRFSLSMCKRLANVVQHAQAHTLPVDLTSGTDWPLRLDDCIGSLRCKYGWPPLDPERAENWGYRARSHYFWWRTRYSVPAVEQEHRRNEYAQILIADDHSVFRDGLRALLEATPNPEGSRATTGEEAILRLHMQPDLILMDVHMPGGTIEATRMRPVPRLVWWCLCLKMRLLYHRHAAGRVARAQDATKEELAAPSGRGNGSIFSRQFAARLSPYFAHPVRRYQRPIPN